MASKARTPSSNRSHEHSKKHHFRFGKPVKSPAPTQDSERAPLLEDTQNQDVEANQSQVCEETPSSWPQRLLCWVQEAVIWVVQNLVTVVLACLLAAGTVFVCVYGGKLLEGSTYPYLQRLVIHRHGPSPSPQPSPICVTQGCVLAASELLHNISPRYKELDPCEDFHAYVCEGWDLRNDLREDQSDAFTGTLMNEESQLLLRHVLESSYSEIMSSGKDSSGVDKDNFQKMQDTYNACMAESLIKKQGSAPLLELLEKLEENFPVDRPRQHAFPKMDPQQQKGLFYSGETPLSNAISYLMSIGVDAMLSFGVSVC